MPTPTYRVATDNLNDFLALRELLQREVSSTGLTMTQYRILLESSASGGARNSELTHLLRLGASGVSAAVNSLEAKGLVVRVDDPDDRRKARIVCTPDGIDAAAKAGNRVIAVREGLWRTLDAEEVDAVMSYTRIAAQHIGTSVQETDRTDVVPSYITSIEVTVSRYAEAARSACSMSLSELRILIALHEADGPVQGNLLSSHLHMNRAEVTSLCNRLVKRGLLEQIRDGADRRSRPFVATETGRELGATGLAALDNVHREIYGNLEPRILELMESANAKVNANIDAML